MIALAALKSCAQPESGLGQLVACGACRKCLVCGGKLKGYTVYTYIYEHDVPTVDVVVVIPFKKGLLLTDDGN